MAEVSAVERGDLGHGTQSAPAPVAAEHRVGRQSGMVWAIASALCVVAAAVCLYAMRHLGATPTGRYVLWGETLLALAALACGEAALSRAGWRAGSAAVTALATACIVLGAILLLLGPALAAAMRL